jgi:CRP-like cAMP-binding protein
MKNLLDAINSFIQVKEKTKKAIQSKTAFISISKKEILLNHGQIADNLYFVRKGLFRGFSMHKRKDVTNWFAKENEFVTSMYSFVSRNPSLETIEALEDSELDFISYKDLNELYGTYAELNMLGRIFVENYYIALEERANSFQFQSAKARYAQFLEKNSVLFHRVKLGHIASYLGITKETLSRIRS